MEPFTFNQAFRDQLREDPHHHGEIEFLESVLKPGMIVIEGGAHCGVTTVATARAVGPTGCVYAFEPVPEHFDCLRKSLAANGITNVTPHNLAISDHAGRLPFYLHGAGSGVTPADEAERIEVEAVTLPRFLQENGIPRIDFLSLDAEGSELLIFQATRGVLVAQHPAIFCEVHRGYLEELGQSVSEVVTFLEAAGYRVRPIQVEDLEGATEFDTCSHLSAVAAC